MGNEVVFAAAMIDCGGDGDRSFAAKGIIKGVAAHGIGIKVKILDTFGDGKWICLFT